MHTYTNTFTHTHEERTGEAADGSVPLTVKYIVAFASAVKVAVAIFVTVVIWHSSNSSTAVPVSE